MLTEHGPEQPAGLGPACSEVGPEDLRAPFLNSPACTGNGQCPFSKCGTAQFYFAIRVNRLHKKIERRARAVLSETKKLGIWEAWSYLANKVLIVNHDEP